jgi:uncharacterized protein (TIGR02996 family)
MGAAHAFLHLILAAPDDDAPRLVYADWLDDAANPADRARAEFIRVQCGLDRLPADDPRRPALAARERQLTAEYAAAWRAPLAGLVSNQEFSRGFVEEVTVEARRLIEHGEAIFAAAPVRHVRLVEAGPVLEKVAACPLLARLRGLTVYAHHLGDRLARALAASPHLAALEVLDLGRNRLTDAGAEALAAAGDRLGGLTTLVLRENSVGESGARALAHAPGLGRLAALDLAINAVGAGGAEALAGSPRLSLRDLDLALNRVGDEGVARLARALPAALPGRPRWRRLSLGDNEVTTVSLPALVESAGVAGVDYLDLSDNEFGDAGARFLAAGPNLAGLRGLELRRCGLGDEGVEALAASPHFAGLRLLDLRQNSFGDRGLRALIDSDRLPRLSALLLSRELSKQQRDHLLKKYGPQLRWRLP